MTARRLTPPPIGWPLLPVPDAHGRLRFPDLETSVRQSIEVLLRTRPGEQLMRPDFGGGLETFVFAPNTMATRSDLRTAVLRTLEAWEDRIEVDRVDVSEVAEDPAGVRLEIAYRITRTGALRTLALTMELEG